MWVLTTKNPKNNLHHRHKEEVEGCEVQLPALRDGETGSFVWNLGRCVQVKTCLCRLLSILNEVYYLNGGHECELSAFRMVGRRNRMRIHIPMSGPTKGSKRASSFVMREKNVIAAKPNQHCLRFSQGIPANIQILPRFQIRSCDNRQRKCRLKYSQCNVSWPWQSLWQNLETAGKRDDTKYCWQCRPADGSIRQSHLTS